MFKFLKSQMKMGTLLLILQKYFSKYDSTVNINKLDNLDEVDTFLETQNPTKTKS